MVAAAAAVVARHLCSDDGDGDGKRAKARSPPPPSVHCGAPFLARGCCCGGGGGRGGAARSWRRRPPLLWLSLARSLGRGSCCRRFSMSWWRRPTLWLSCCRRFSMSWCRRTTLWLLADCWCRLDSGLCSATARHDQTAFGSPRPPGTAARSVSRGASQGRRGPTTCCGSCAVSGELRAAEQTDPDDRDDGIERAAGGRRERGPPCRGPITEAAGSRSPACLSAARHCPGWSRPPCCSSVGNQHGHRRASQPAP